jgi:hypothetical protein
MLGALKWFAGVTSEEGPVEDANVLNSQDPCVEGADMSNSVGLPL